MHSIAVLPLADFTGGAAPPYLAEAVTDQLTSTLGQLRGLRVISRTSVTALGAQVPPVAEIAQRLGVTSVLEGTIAIAEGTEGGAARIRVNARLIAAGTDGQIWSGSFERALGDTFALQTDVARAIAREIGITISPAEGARLARERSTSPQAEAAYFEGRHHIQYYGAARATQARRAFERAVALAPDYAPAHAGLARSFVRLGFDGAITQAEARARALAASRRALEIDDASADAHATAADLMFLYDWAWADAEQSYARAIELHPSASDVRQQFARYLAAMGRVGDAVSQTAEAVRIDPLSVEAAQTHGLMLYFARQYDEAARELTRAHALSPDASGTHVILSRVREAQQRYGESLALAKEALAIAEHPGVRAHAARQMALAGDEAGARAALQSVGAFGLRARPDSQAYAVLALGDPEGALTLLEQAETERDPAILWLAVDPRVDSLRAQPRFRALLQRLGVPGNPDNP